MNAEQVKQQFRAEGRTLSGWARDNGYRPAEVYAVLNGFLKGRHGKSHQIAVKLGIKPNPEKLAA